ncbi:MAG: hypothetical protein Q9209_003134 [Squamulea sp. 1 TL-2023]
MIVDDAGAGADAMQWVPPSREHHCEDIDGDQMTLKSTNHLPGPESEQYAPMQNGEIHDTRAATQFHTPTKQPLMPIVKSHLSPAAVTASSSSSNDRKDSTTTSHHPSDKGSEDIEKTHQQADGSLGPSAKVEREDHKDIAPAPSFTAPLDNDDDDFWNKLCVDGPSLDLEAVWTFSHGQNVPRPAASRDTRKDSPESSREGNQAGEQDDGNFHNDLAKAPSVVQQVLDGLEEITGSPEELVAVDDMIEKDKIANKATYDNIARIDSMPAIETNDPSFWKTLSSLAAEPRGTQHAALPSSPQQPIKRTPYLRPEDVLAGSFQDLKLQEEYVRKHGLRQQLNASRKSPANNSASGSEVKTPGLKFANMKISISR